MADKNYTPEQMADAKRLAEILANIPQERRGMVTMMASAFIAGIETQTQIVAAEKAAT